MMTAPHSINRSMFWRIIRRLLSSNRRRLFVMLLALGAGAAITAALLNLQVDAKRRLTTEFRAFGANVVVAPRDAGALKTPMLEESVMKQIPRNAENQRVTVLGVLYLVADAQRHAADRSAKVVVAGESSNDSAATSDRQVNCSVGTKASDALHLQEVNNQLTLRNQNREETCRVAAIQATGGPEDNQVSLPLPVAQRLAALPGRISLIQISVPGTPEEISNYISALAYHLPSAEVRGVRQFTEGEAKIYNRISGVLTGTVALVLILTGLCVMAAMTNVAMERRNDVGLMKAIGGATRRVLRLFLTEAALLGLAGGLFGGAVGILLSIWLGKAVFGVAARPRLIVYPVAVVLTILVSIAGAYPLRRLANIRPASVFRGEA